MNMGDVMIYTGIAVAAFGVIGLAGSILVTGKRIRGRRDRLFDRLGM